MEYRIVYSDRRTVSLCVKGAEIIVRAPRAVSEKRIAEIVEKHKEWIEKQLEKQAGAGERIVKGVVAVGAVDVERFNQVCERVTA